ncbi:dipeptide/oligopeptide/nickel ABC transporter ATP-binding protein [Candidatus Epulonipiscium fishelsonii]|nr:dipeptide/oligopeptide/nickel ABC transporter ATP-binding protein [Epulopiscium sp. SCG-C06WGA-EpuloA1]
MDNSKILEIKDLYVEYKTDEAVIYALNGIDLTLNRGETLGIVGETGAGKTTLALSILRLLPKKVGSIKKGEIYFDEVDLLKEKELNMLLYRGKKISMIFQDPMTSLNPLLTVGKQVAEVLKLHNEDNLTDAEIEKKVDKMLELVGIPASRKTEYPHQFSGGMKQRVVIAISLICNPELLIADEPTTALDVTIQAQVLNLMEDLKKELGTSMLLITHDLGVVAQTCDSVAVMYAGEIVEYGSVENIFEGKHHHPYTEGLFASIPDLNSTTSRLNPIDGLMPDMSLKVSGCRFSVRCKFKTQDCLKEQNMTEASDGHFIRCNRYLSGGEK